MKRRIFTLFVTLLSFTGIAYSQQYFIGEMVIDRLRLEASPDSACVFMRLDFSDLYLKSNQEVELCPSLVLDDTARSLPPIKIMGRRRYCYDARNRKAGGGSKKCLCVKRTKDQCQHLYYSASLPLERLPRRLQLKINGVWSGCHCEMFDLRNDIISERTYYVDGFRPIMAYVVPPLETDKQRVEKGSAYVEFRVGSATVLPRYRDNEFELEKMGEKIRQIAEDDDVLLRRIQITGYASPEGGFVSNQQLAQRRTQALIDYLLEHFAVDTCRVVLGWGNEDWETLRTYVEESTTENREEILELIDGEGDWDEKEQKLRQNFADVYMDLQKICFPRLRRTDYEIYYALRSFSPEEARVLLWDAPQKLSLYEIYAAGQTFSPGSEPYYDAFDIAVKQYPEDAVANLNAGQAALERLRLSEAEKYLEKAGIGGEAVMARGILAYWQKEIGVARQLLKEAERMGIAAARENLENINAIEQFP